MKSKTTKMVERRMARMARSFFVGIAVPQMVEVKDERFIDDGETEYETGTGIGPYAKGTRLARCEQLHKFNRKTLLNKRSQNEVAVDPRQWGTEDRMRFPVGQPGSQARKDALALQYASLGEEEVSPFATYPGEDN
jgi:hypothetical protein